jgi:hypothetical protein
MGINLYLRVGPIPLYHKYCHNSKYAVIPAVSALVYEVEPSGLRNEHPLEACLSLDVWTAESRTISIRGGMITIQVIIDIKIHIPVCILIAHNINIVTTKENKNKQTQAQQVVL